MRILVTAGNTQAPLDRVRCITNVFTGRTGATLAAEAAARGHAVTLLTSHPKAHPLPEAVEVAPYRTFDDLHALMEQRIRGGSPDAVIHCAAVSDYLPAATYSVPASVRFDAASATWHGEPPRLRPQDAGGKIKSDESELWLRMVRAPKLIDRIRDPWGFTGTLVKFKLEVGLTDEELLGVAERSRRHSSADLMVANCLEWAGERAYLGPLNGTYASVERAALPGRLLDAIEGR